MTQFPTRDFIALANGVAKTGKFQQMTVRTLLSHFGQERRGSEVVRSMHRKLRSLGVETEPRFDAVHVDSTVQIIPRQKRAPGRPRKYDGASVPVSPARSSPAEPMPPAPLVVKSEEATLAEESRCPYLTIGLLASANRKPYSVRANDSLESAVTLMMLHNISHVPVMQSERGVDGMITWRSIGNRKAANKQAASARDCMEKEVRIVAQDAPRAAARWG